jgi:hypothetical protein
MSEDDKKLSGLSPLSDFQDSDEFYVVRNSLSRRMPGRFIQKPRLDDLAAQILLGLSGGAPIYADIATGLSNTSGTGDTGRYFGVPSAESAKYSILYLNNGGTEEETGTLPSGLLVREIQLGQKAWEVEPISYTNGSYIDESDGSLVANSNLRYSILTLPADTIALRVSGTIESVQVSLAVFYTAGDVFISSSPIVGTGSAVTYTEEVIAIPSNAAKIGISSRTQIPPHVVETKVAEYALGEDVNTLKVAAVFNAQAVESLSEWANEAYTYVVGSYYDVDDGSVVTNASFHRAIYTIGDRVSAIRISAVINSNQNGLAVFFDADDNYLGFQDKGTNSAVTYTEQLITLPRGTAKIGLSNRVTESNHTIELLTVDASVIERIKAIETGDTVTAVSAWEPEVVTYVNETYYDKDDGIIVSNSSFHRALYTIDAGVSSLRVSATINSTQNALAVFFDADDNYLGFQTAGTGSDATYDKEVLVLPSGTAKIGLSNRISEGGHFLEVFKIITDLATRVIALQEGGTGGALPVTFLGDSTSIDGVNGLADEVEILMPERTIYPQGIGGQDWEGQISPRIGLKIATVVVAGGVIPSSLAAVACTISSAMLNHPSPTTEAVMQVMVVGVRCELRKGSGDAYTLKAMDGLNADVAVADDSPVKVLTGFVTGVGADATTCTPLGELLRGVVVVRTLPSINDRSNFANRVLMETLVDDVITQLTKYTGKVLLLSIMNGEKDLTTALSALAENATAALSYRTLSGVRDLNNYTRNRWPYFVDTLQAHIDNGGGETFDIDGVDFTVLTTTATTPKIKSDGRHETQDAIDESAQLVVDYINANW